MFGAVLSLKNINLDNGYKTPILNSWQKRIITTAWITYAAYYLCRVNISIALPALQDNLHLTKGQAGLITTGFFWAYAIGQIINGRLGDRMSPRRLVCIGMLSSAALNLLFGSLTFLPALIIVWMINGYFQAMGWGPILRTLANWLTPAQRTRVSSLFGSCFVVGNALTWLLTGRLVATFGWRAAFWVPACLMIMIALGWYFFIRDEPADQSRARLEFAEVPLVSFNWSSLIADLFVSLRRFWSLVMACIFFGFTFASLIVWLPTYYVEVQKLGIDSASVLSTLVPVAGVFGTLLIGGWIGRSWIGQERIGLMIILIALAVSLILYPAVHGGLMMSTLLLGLIGAMAYGATSVLLTTIPLVAGGAGEASSTAGLLDLTFNIGAGLSGGIIGLLLDKGGWNMVFLGQGLAVLLAAFSLLLQKKQKGVTL